MGAKQKQKCTICGEEYDVCAYCPRTTKYTPWRAVCCTQDHFLLHTLINAYVCGVVTKEEAADELVTIHKIDQIDTTKFLPEVQATIAEIMAVRKTAAKSKKRNVVVEEEKTEE